MAEIPQWQVSKVILLVSLANPLRYLLFFLQVLVASEIKIPSRVNHYNFYVQEAVGVILTMQMYIQMQRMKHATFHIIH